MCHSIGCQDDLTALIITQTLKEQYNDATANFCTDNNYAIVITEFTVKVRITHIWKKDACAL